MPIFDADQLASMRDTLELVRTQTVQIHPYTPGAEDEFGNEAKAWGAPTTEDALIVPLSTSETLTDRTVEITDKKIRLRHDIVLDGREKVTIGSDTYTLIGPPEYHQAPDGVLQTTATLRRVDGL